MIGRGALGGLDLQEEALDRLANPERLDAPLRLVAAPHWVLLAGFAALVAAALVWAGATLAPVKVAGRGILIDRAGLSEIVASDAGQIAAVTVAAGDSVVRGQPIAVLSGSELEREIADTAARLTQARTRLARLGTYADQTRSGARPTATGSPASAAPAPSSTAGGSRSRKRCAGSRRLCRAASSAATP